MFNKKTPLLQGEISYDMDDLLQNNKLSGTEKAKIIQNNYENEIKRLDNELRKFKTKQYIGAGLQIGSALIPIGAGAGVGVGIAKSLTPKLGAKIAQEVGTGIGGGALSGAVEGFGRGLFENKNPWKSMISDATIGALLGGGGGYGLGKLGQGLTRRNLLKNWNDELGTQYFNDYIADLDNKTNAMADFRGIRQGVKSGNSNIAYDLSQNLNKERLKAIRQAGRKFYKENLKNMDIYRDDIGKIHFGNAGIDEQVSKGLQDIDILPELQNQIKTGEYKGIRNDKPRGDIDFFHILENENNGKRYEYQIANDANGNKYYFAKNIKEESPRSDWKQYPGSKDISNNSITDYNKNLKSFAENNYQDLFDKNGEPITVFHGSPDFNIKIFDANKSNYGNVSKGFNFFTNKKSGYQNSAKDYAEFAGTNGYKRQGQIYEAYLSMKNPLHIKYRNQVYWDSINNKPVNEVYSTPVEYYDGNYKAIKEQYKKGNYDGLIIENLDKNNDDYIMYAVPNSRQIKSVNNQGTFDPTNPNIYKSILGVLGTGTMLRQKEGK